MFASRRLLVLSALASALLSAMAQETLTLDAAVHFARLHHPSLQAAQADAAAAAATLRGARALRNPEIIVTPNVLGPAGSDELLSLTQPLDITGARQARANIAGGHLDALQAEQRVTERAVILAVQTAYWALTQAHAIAAFDAEHVAHADTLVTTARTQVELGNEPTSHRIKAEVELARARQQLARSQAAVSQARVALNAAMGRAPETPIALAETPAFAPVALDDATLTEQGFANRPELRREQALVTAAGGDVEAARAARRPDLTVQLRQEAWDGDGGIGVGISLPLLDWGSARAERDRARATVLAQQHRVQATRLAIQQQISDALIAVRSAETQIVTLRDQVVQPAETLAQMAAIGYQEGAMSYLEVLEARRTLRAAHVEYASALGEYRTALAQLEWATGTKVRPTSSTEALP